MAGRKPIPKTLDVFISYSRRDQAVADRVHQRLIERRLSCFYDVRSMGVGDEWRPRLYRAIQSARVVVLIISPSSLESEEVRRETNKALCFGAILCPIVVGTVDYDSDLCLLVNEYHWLESREPPSDEELDQLVERVAAIVGVDEKVPTVRLTSPAGPETWTPGQTVHLAWDAQAAEGTSLQQISMELLADGATVYSFPGKNAPWAGTVRECDWTIPITLPPGQYLMRVVAINNLGHVGFAESAAPLAISVPATATPEIPPKDIASPANETSTRTTAPVPALTVVEPAAGARWTLGKLECLRLELSDADDCGLTAGLTLADGSLRPLVQLNPLELRGKRTQSSGHRFAVIPVAIPFVLATGPKTLRIELTAANGMIAATRDVAIELSQPVAKRLSNFEETECVQAGLGFSVMAIAAAAAIALLRQCMPVIRQLSLMTPNFQQVATQLAEAAGAVLWQNIVIIPTVAVFAGIAMIAGSLLWLHETRKSLAAALTGAAWGGTLGLGLSLLSADAPVAPVKLVPIVDLDHLFQLGQQTERSRIGSLLRPQGLPAEPKTFSEVAQLLKSASKDQGLGGIADQVGAKPAGTLIPTPGSLPLDPSQSLFNKFQTSSYKSLSELMKEIKTVEDLKPSDSSSPSVPTPPAGEQSSPHPAGTAASGAISPAPPAPKNLPTDQPATVMATQLPPLTDFKPLPGTKLAESLAYLSPTSVQAAAPTWHKQPLTAMWSWAFWGAVLGAVLGCAVPYLEKPK